MLRWISAMSGLLWAVAAAGLVAVLGYGGWIGYRTYFAHDLQIRERDQALAEKDAELERQRTRIATLHDEVAAGQQQIRRLETAVRLLKVDRRVAQVIVVDQRAAEGDRPLQTDFRFVEVDEEGRPLEEPRVYTIDGDVLYVDAWVVKFADEHVETEDPLRSTSICLFRRLFGEFQEPSQGFVLDAVGSRPAAYSRGSEATPLEQELWANFWEYANDAATAGAAGVRAAHGEAPSIKLRPGRIYKLQLRASDGLSIVAEDLPAAVREGPN